jgi:hypothetical protein
MSQTSKKYDWGNNNSRQENSGFSSNSFCSSSLNGDKNTASSTGFNSVNSSFVNVESSNNNLPKFSDTFCSSLGENSYKSGGASRQNSSEHNLFGDPKKKLDWDGLVDKVFIEEIVKLSDTVRNKSFI